MRVRCDCSSAARRFPGGAAYSTRFKDHLLNVRASNMSAFADRPDHFIDWLASEGEAAAAAFVPRSRHGDYLQTLLTRAATRSEAGRLAHRGFGPPRG